MIDLTIKTLDSQNHKFKVPDTYTILELKEHIAEQVNVTVVQQRLIFCGRVLSNETKLSDIGIDGKVMHLVQKVPRLASTTSGISSSTTTNTNSRSGQNGGPGFRGWHTHDPTVVIGAIGIPSELMHAGELPRLVNARNHGNNANRLSLAMDMIRRGNEILRRLENPRNTGRTADADQLPEGQQQTEETSRNVPPETSAPELQTDPDSMNLYEVDETFSNTVVVTIDATHHMRMPPGLMRHMHNHLHANNLSAQNLTEQTAERQNTTVPETTPVGLNNQSSTEQATGSTPLVGISEQNLRNDRQTPENRASAAIAYRRRLRELIEQLNKLNIRLQPFYARYCQYINDDPHFESVEGESGSQRAQAIFNGVSEVMHYISHVYHAISDLRVAFSRPPPRSFQSRPSLLQGTFLHSAHSFATTSATPPSTQQPTSTQTTTTSQSIPSVRASRLDFMNPEGVGNETTPNVSTAATSAETNTNMTNLVDPNLLTNLSQFLPPESSLGVELMLDIAPRSIRIDSVEATSVIPNASGSSQPATVSQPSTGNETSNNMSMPIDWMDQMIDVISSGVRRPFMSDQPDPDWISIPTTSTHTPRVTPRTTDSSSSVNPPTQGLNRGRLNTAPRMDPFLPCSSHHFESNLRPMVLSRRTTQGMERSTTSSTTSSSNSTTDTSTPTSPNEIRASLTGRRTARPRTRYVQDAEGFLSGIHPIMTWGRNHRNNIAVTSGSNNVQQGSGLTADTLSGRIRIGMESVFDTLEREVDFDIARNLNIHPPNNSTLATESTTSTVTQSIARQNEELLHTPIGNIPYFRDMEGRSILFDLLLMIARNWTLHDILNLNTDDLQSSIRQNPVSRNSEALVNFILIRVMGDRPRSNHSIEEAAHRLHLEMITYINVFQCSVPTRNNIDVIASFRRCIIHNLHQLVINCEQILGRASLDIDIVSALTVFAEALLSLIVYCCNSRAVFRLSIGSLIQFLPLPPNLQSLIMDQVRMNIDKYWNIIASLQMIRLSAVDYIVPNSSETQGGQTSRTDNEEQSSNQTLPSNEITNEPEVVIGSQEWHQSVPSEWVPVITRDSQRQRRQGTQPPYSDAYLSGMPNKRRKIVTSSKSQGSLSQIIAKNLEVAMSAAGVAINKEVTTIVGADTAVQNAYSERIRSRGRFRLDTNPDFCPVRYPNASKFFYD